MLRPHVNTGSPASARNHRPGGIAQRPEALNPPTQPEEPWSEHYFYKAVALEHVGRKADARALYERLARLNDEQQMLDSEPWPPTGAIRFALAGSALKALGRQAEARARWSALEMDPQSELARLQLAELRGGSRMEGCRLANDN
jgi:hypothetical protein